LIYPEVKNRENVYGLCASSSSCYEKFNKLYYPYIKEISGGYDPNTGEGLDENGFSTNRVITPAQN
jgi:hypothetical protein